MAPIDSADKDLSQLTQAAASASLLLRGLLAHHINNALAVVVAGLQFASERATGEDQVALTEALEAARRIEAIVAAVRGGEENVHA
jgi:two-component sensor histidine kinase